MYSYSYLSFGLCNFRISKIHSEPDLSGRGYYMGSGRGSVSDGLVEV